MIRILVRFGVRVFRLVRVVKVVKVVKVVRSGSRSRIIGKCLESWNQSLFNNKLSQYGLTDQAYVSSYQGSWKGTNAVTGTFTCGPSAGMNSDVFKGPQPI